MARMRTWYSEKRNAVAMKRRFWDLGADLDDDGCLRILRLPCGAQKDGNRCLKLYQGDTEKNPDALDIVQLGTGHAITVRTVDGGNVLGGLSRTGTAISSALALKDNLKNIGDSVAEKFLGVPIKSWNYKDVPEERLVGPTAEDFKKITGYGDGKTINATTFLGVTFRALQFVFKRTQALEARLDEKAESLEARLDLMEPPDTDQEA